MAALRLYRTFYNVALNNEGGYISESYNLIEPYSLSAYTTVDLDNSSFIESFLSPTEESVGVYYVDLNPTLYAFDYTYRLDWYVIYEDIAPVRILRTKFRLSPNNISGGIQVEILNNNSLNVQILNNVVNIKIKD